MKTIADPPQRDRWARLRFSIIGPLLAAPPGPGQLNSALAALAAKTWRHPVTGLDVRFGASTLERWYYTARRAADPVAALKDRLHANEGCFPSLSAVAVATLSAQYREHPGWTAQLHLDNLRVACKASEPDGTSTPVASYTTVRRYLRAQGMHRQVRPKRATEGAVAARDRLELRISAIVDARFRLIVDGVSWRSWTIGTHASDGVDGISVVHVDAEADRVVHAGEDRRGGQRGAEGDGSGSRNAGAGLSTAAGGRRLRRTHDRRGGQAVFEARRLFRDRCHNA